MPTCKESPMQMVSVSMVSIGAKTVKSNKTTLSQSFEDGNKVSKRDVNLNPKEVEAFKPKARVY